MLQDGTFCFLTDQYFYDFPDERLMRNKETTNGILHSRPCFFAFPDVQNKNIVWLVPISSKVEKYKIHYEKKMERYGFCNTIHFGNVAGTEAAFLIQNICPATEKYISSVYVDKNNRPIHIDQRTVTTVIKKSKKVLSDYFRGNKSIFPDVKTIKSVLILQCQEQKKALQPMNNPKPSIQERLAAAKETVAQREADRREGPQLPPHKSDPER